MGFAPTGFVRDVTLLLHMTTLTTVNSAVIPLESGADGVTALMIDRAHRE